MFGSNRFSPDGDIPDLAEKVILITGGNTGLGKETALQLAKHNPASVYITSRSLKKGRTAVDDIKAIVPTSNVQVLSVDLSDLTSVRKAAAQFLANSSRLDILINNAGIMAVPAVTTVDGYEIQFATNYLGHALLTNLLLPTLLQTSQKTGGNTRIVTLSSVAHSWTPRGGIALSTLKSAQEDVSTVARYGQSKLATILLTREIAHRYPASITAVAVDPGNVKTTLSASARESSLLMRLADNVARSLIGVDVEQGAWNTLWAATSEDVESGEFYSPVGKKTAGSLDSRDKTLAKKLWEWTEVEVMN